MKIFVEDYGKKICWVNNSVSRCKEYINLIMGYEILPDGSGFIVLEPYQDAGKNNAVIYNIDGTERWRLPFTNKSGEGVYFDRVGIVEGELNVIAIIDNRDVGFIVDYNKNEYKNIYSSR